jgi:hypothetical protein
MLDLRILTEDFIRKDWPRLEGDNSWDESVLRAINGVTMDLTDRERQLLAWLHSYKVLLFFPPDKSSQVARQILDFADNERTPTRVLDRDSISGAYQKLYGRLSEAAHKSPQSGNPRDVSSLTSKALWCCYPSDVPIFDDHAARALQVISRLLRIKATKSVEYERFIEVWFKVYDKISPAIDAAGLKDYPYKVRILDRLLWHLGQPSFDMA